MRHPHRWDLPKGRLDPGETIEQAALRELVEETGFRADEIQTAPDFRYVTTYELPPSKGGQRRKVKEMTILLGWIEQAKTPILTEHEGFAWWNWNPPHRIQNSAIDPLMRYAEEYFHNQSILWNQPGLP